MDIENCIERYIKHEKDADNDHWLACEAAWDARNTGRPNWAEQVARWSVQGDDIVRYKCNAWEMWLLLLSERRDAEKIRESLTYSLFKNAYKFIGRTYMLQGVSETYREIVTVDNVIDSLIQAYDEGLTVRAHEKILDDSYGEKDPHDKYMARFDRFKDELKYIIGMVEANGISEAEQMLLKNLKLGLEIIDEM